MSKKPGLDSIFQKYFLILKRSVYPPQLYTPVFWADVSDQWLSATLDQNSALLIGLWQNHELYVSKKLFMYITLLSFQKHRSSFSFGYSDILKFIIVHKTKCFLKLILTSWHKPVHLNNKLSLFTLYRKFGVSSKKGITKICKEIKIRE